jgi:hypothetical protein
MCFNLRETIMAKKLLPKTLEQIENKLDRLFTKSSRYIIYKGNNVYYNTKGLRTLKRYARLAKRIR